ncbi:MAG: glycosyltransferase [Planctomycetota bacterium]
MPRVSVGIPVHNGERFLPGALDSIVGQSFADLEICIADNASTDGTWEICRAYALRDPRIRLHREPVNQGAARNYNRVFEMASGAYFMWAAADDLCAPTKIERCVAALDRDAELVLAYPRTTIIDADGTVLGSYQDQLDLRDRSAVRRFALLMRHLRECNAVWGVMRTAVLRETDLIGNYPSSDLVLLAQMALRGRFHEVPEHLFWRRDHAGQSVRKHPTPRSRVGWFDPARAGRLVFPTWRLWAEYGRAIRRAPLSRREQLGCLLQSAWWLRRKYLEMLREVAFALTHPIGAARRAARMIEAGASDAPASTARRSGISCRDHSSMMSDDL